MNQPTLSDAIALARRAHEGQCDKSGAAYFGHVERVMHGVEGEELKIIAILHDSIEDTDETTPINVTVEFLLAAGYPAHIVEAIDSLTKRPDEENSDEGYMRFVQRAAKNPLAREVKKADLRDNMDLTRLPGATEEDFRRLERYQRALGFLEALPSFGVR